MLAGGPCSEHWLLLSSGVWCWEGVCSKGTAGDLLTSLRPGSLALDQKAVRLHPWFSLGVLLTLPKVNTAVTSSRWPSCGAAGAAGSPPLLTSFGCLFSSVHPLGEAWSRLACVPATPPTPVPIPLSLFCSLCVVSSVAPRGWRVVHIPRPQLCPGHPRSRRCLTGCGRVSSGCEALRVTDMHTGSATCVGNRRLCTAALGAPPQALLPFVRAALGTLGSLCCRVTEAQVRREAAGGDVPLPRVARMALLLSLLAQALPPVFIIFFSSFPWPQRNSPEFN